MLMNDHTHPPGWYDPVCPACLATAAEDYVRFLHLLEPDEEGM
jgi:hypothetical protein